MDKGEYRDKMRLCFNILDLDKDGYLDASDLEKLSEMTNMDCSFGKELQVFLDHFSVTNLRIKTKPKLSDALDFEKYLLLL